MRFLCFTDFSRLSGITRAAGGIPIPRRARRRASFSTRSRGFFFDRIMHRPKNYHTSQFDVSRQSGSIGIQF